MSRFRGDRLLLEWWREPGDYLWLVEFLQLRGLFGRLRIFVGIGGVIVGIAAGCMLPQPLLGPAAVGTGLAIVMIFTSTCWSVYWWFFPWPSERTSLTAFLFADVVIVLATVAHDNPLVGMGITPLFAMTGAYFVFFHSPRCNAVHLALAVCAIVGTAVRLGVSGLPDARYLALSTSLIALTLTVGIFPFIQFGFWLVRSSSVESLTDPLTDLANRRGLMHYLARRIDRLPMSAEALCALVIDLDGFKRINDEFGHHTGDTVIVSAAEQIRAVVAASAFVARTGGEEFVVVDALPLRVAIEIAERIRHGIESSTSPRATASIGVAAGLIVNVNEFEAVHARADDAMYVAKREGGNRVAIDDAYADAGSESPIEIDSGTRQYESVKGPAVGWRPRRKKSRQRSPRGLTAP